jgi:hypothetical protein
VSLGVFGVISTGTGPTCASSRYTYATGLDRGALRGKKSNWDWTNETIARTCTKKAVFGAGCLGTVVGSISPAQSVRLETTDPDSLSLNNEIDVGDVCGTSDTTEFVHFGQTLTVTATPAPGYYLDGWRGDDSGHPCPCTSSTCTLAYNDIGTYSPGESYDTTKCTPVFRAYDPDPPAWCCNDPSSPAYQQCVECVPVISPSP